MKELMHAVWEYQFFWLPLAVGMGVGVLAIATGNVVMQRRRRAAAVQEAQNLVNSKSPSESYDPFALGSPSDQRKAFRRRGNPVEIIYKFPDDKNLRHGLVLDRSVGGMRLGLDSEVAVGSRVLVKPTNSSDMVPWTELEVRICLSVGDSWEVGCQFVKVPPWSVLLTFG